SACDEAGPEARNLPAGSVSARHEPGQGGEDPFPPPGLAEGHGPREPVSVAPLLRDGKLRGLGPCPLRSSGHGVSAPDDPRSGGGAAGGLDPHSSEGVYTAGGPIESRRS